MVRWCAYCQKFLGELPPYDSFQLTHGMCAQCRAKGLTYTDQDEVRLKRLIDVQKKLWSLGSGSDTKAALDILDESIAVGVRPADFLMGFMSPLFYSNANSIESAKLSEFCKVIIDSARSKLPKEALKENPDVLLTVPLSNQHRMSIQFLELWLLGEGILAASFFPKSSDDEIFQICQEKIPKVVGFSLSMVEQVGDMMKIIGQIKAHSSPAPLFLLGGYVAKNGLLQPNDVPGVSIIPNEEKLFLTIKTHLSLGFLYDLKKNKRHLKKE